MRWFLMACVLATVGCLAVRGDEVKLPAPEGYERSYMQLISQESLSGWSAAWTGPIQAATGLAWLYDNSYTRVVQDLNGDGVIDTLDTIQLADQLGKGPMQTMTPTGTTDVRLVIALARYMAERYPDQFELRIYDPSFPAEYSLEGLGTFAPSSVPGILLALKDEPAIGAYKTEMSNGAAVIVGLEVTPGQNNTYLSGRSYLYQTNADGYTPIDLAWAAEDDWAPGRQGQVLNTLGRETDRLHLKYREAWTPAEILVALSPVERPSAGSTPVGCPTDAIGHDVVVATLTSKPATGAAPATLGSVRLEECVTRVERDGRTLDTYTYTLTNIDLSFEGRGVTTFSVLTRGEQSYWGRLSTVEMTGPPFWEPRQSSNDWIWIGAAGTRGVLPGESAVFSLTVVGPTRDVASTAVVYSGSFPSSCLYDLLATTGPGVGTCCYPDGRCECVPASTCVEGGGVYRGDACDCFQCMPPKPDLVVDASASCEIMTSDLGSWYTVTVEAEVRNDGKAAAKDVTLYLGTEIGEETETISTLAPGQRKSFTVTFQTTETQTRVDWQAVVDPAAVISEEDELNNRETGTADCRY